MYEVSSVGGSKFDAAAAIQQQAAPRHHPNTMKEQMRRFLRGPKTLMRSTSDSKHHRHSTGNNHNHHHHHSHNNHNNNGEQQKACSRNGMVVAIVDGLPFVVGAKNKKAAHTHGHVCNSFFVIVIVNFLINVYFAAQGYLIIVSLCFY